ncbi:MAG: type II 3-dehydroquinate dehydratase, partial [Myxococcota bacterium]
MPDVLRVLVLNGPNLNLLGQRETEWYGTTDLATIVAELEAEAASLGVTITHAQHNGEGAMVDAIQKTKADGAVINAAAYTHTSVALRD